MDKNPNERLFVPVRTSVGKSVRGEDTRVHPTVPGYVDRLNQGGGWVGLPPYYEQGGWPDFEQVMETSPSPP